VPAAVTNGKDGRRGKEGGRQGRASLALTSIIPSDHKHSLERCHDVASFSAELKDMLSSPLPPFHPPALPRALAPHAQADGRETRRRRRRRTITAPPSQYRQVRRNREEKRNESQKGAR